MEKSTVLQKTSRIRICDKTKLANLVNHILRNYKPDTIQYKRDFNADDTKLNLVICPDFKVIKKGADWFDKVQNCLRNQPYLETQQLLKSYQLKCLRQTAGHLV